MGEGVLLVVEFLVVADAFVQAVLLPVLQVDSFDLEHQFLDEVVELSGVRGTLRNMSRGRPIASMVLRMFSEMMSSPRYCR